MKSLLHPALQGLVARSGGMPAWRRRAEIALACLLALQTARLAWLALVPPAPLGEPPATAAPPAARQERLAIDAFNPSRATAAVAADSSGLRLYSARVVGADGSGSAILAGSDGRQAAFAVGDEVRPGVLLAAVHRDRVVLESAGSRRELRFERQPAAVARTGSAGPAALPTALPASPPAASASNEAVDPAQLLAQAGLRPHDEGGKVAGYSVVPRGDGAILRQAGLQAGDVLLSVNGQALTPERYSALAGDLAGASSITLTYRRGEQTRTTTLQAKTP